MKFATALAFFPPAPFDPEPIVHYAQAADRVGFESIFDPEHVAIPHDYQSRYPYRQEGKLPGDDEDMNWPEPLLCLSYVAAVTKRIRLGTIVIILPLRHPLYIAKEMATLDVLSRRARNTSGIGSGWLKEEFEALGLDFHVRGKRTDESIQAIRALWRDNPVSFSGQHFNFGSAQEFSQATPAQWDSDLRGRQFAPCAAAHRALWQRLHPRWNGGGGGADFRSVEGRMRADRTQSRGNRIVLPVRTDRRRRQALRGLGGHPGDDRGAADLQL